MSARYTNNTAAFLAKVEAAQKAGLIAAAQIIVNAVKQGLAGGYTSGSFVTGNVLNSVTRSEVARGVSGFEIRVGSNVPYALYWELGHHNIFTRRFERVEIWVPAMVNSATLTKAAYTRAFKRVLES